LLHLKVKGTLWDISDMGLSESQPKHQRLWAYRRLRTFHIGIRPCRNSQGRGPQGSRIFFAYLVKCFPNLRDIHIHDSDLHLSLVNGLCLLSELHHLEKLVLHTSDDTQSLQDCEMDWMSTLVAHRQPVIGGVRMCYQHDNMGLQHQRYGKEAAAAASCAADAALHQAIWEASTLLHVFSVLERLWSQQTIGVYCWPSLELLQLNTWSTPSWVPTAKPELLYQEKKPLTG
jgi:hypothetical protein